MIGFYLNTCILLPETGMSEFLICNSFKYFFIILIFKVSSQPEVYIIFGNFIFLGIQNLLPDMRICDLFLHKSLHFQ